MGDSFFYSFNENGKLTDLPASFKRPAGTITQAGANNFLNAFNSASYTFNKDASDIINGADTPLTDRDTFSINQPGYCALDANWQTDPAACVAITGTLTYSPSTPTSGSVEVTLTLNQSGTLTTSGWTEINATTFTKPYSDNVTNERVDFINSFGLTTGFQLVTIDRIDTNAPYALQVNYSPSTATSGNVEVEIILNESGTIAGRNGTGTTRTKLFTNNES